MLSKMYKHLAMQCKVEKLANNDNMGLCKIPWKRIKCLKSSLPFLDPEADIILVQEDLRAGRHRPRATRHEAEEV